MFMNRFFPKVLLACLLGAVTNLAFSQEDAAPAAVDIVISSGLEGGGYWNAGNRLQTVAGGIGLAVKNQASTGSVINLRKLLDKDSPVSLAFAQADALQYYLNDNPGAAQAIETLEDIGEECVFIISDKDSKIRTLEDMQDQRRLGLAIRSPNSGIRVTFDYMKSLVPELDFISVYYGNSVDMMENFTTSLTQVKAVMIVQGPNERSPEIDLVHANPDRFQFVKIVDKRFSQSQSGGEATYQSVRVAPGAVAGASRVQTICMQGLFLANKDKLSVEQRNKLTELINDHWGQVSETGK
jgi:TRAP-type uncharacterized transport system substrate-binding protein